MLGLRQRRLVQVIAVSRILVAVFKNQKIWAHLADLSFGDGLKNRSKLEEFIYHYITDNRTILILMTS